VPNFRKKLRFFALLFFFLRAILNFSSIGISPRVIVTEDEK